MGKKLVRFDWAIKKLLRHKANFTILEGFLTELLKFEVVIVNVLEGESNKGEPKDKYNRVDILVKSAEGELMLVEVQNESQADYFQRMIYGASKLITEYIWEGEPYSDIKKVYSINIVYFELGVGTDYIYVYDGKFIGIHNGDILEPTLTQKNKFNVEQIKDIFPKYYLLKAHNFDNIAKNTLDEWIYFLKNSEIKESFTAKGLKEASDKLNEDKLSDEERRAYKRFQENRRIERSVIETALQEGEDKGMKKGEEKGRKEGMEVTIEAFKMYKAGKAPQEIADALGLTLSGVENLLKNFE